MAYRRKAKPVIYDTNLNVRSRLGAALLNAHINERLPLLARNGPPGTSVQCPLSGVKQTSRHKARDFRFDPKPTCSGPLLDHLVGASE